MLVWGDSIWRRLIHFVAKECGYVQSHRDLFSFESTRALVMLSVTARLTVSRPSSSYQRCQMVLRSGLCVVHDSSSTPNWEKHLLDLSLHGHGHVQRAKDLPQTVARILEVHNYLKCLYVVAINPILIGNAKKKKGKTKSAHYLWPHVSMFHIHIQHWHALKCRLLNVFSSIIAA